MPLENPLQLRYRTSFPSINDVDPGIVLPVFLAFLLFSQVPVAFIAFDTGLPNRSLMIFVRSLIAIFSILVILLDLPVRFKLWARIVCAFWCFYLLRLLFDVSLFRVQLAYPAWEIIAWGVGSTLLPTLAVFILASRTVKGLESSTLIISGVVALGFSLLYFLLNLNPLISRFELPELNPINAGHSGCSLFLISLTAFSYPAAELQCRLRNWLLFSGMAIGAFITLYSATRSAFLSLLLGLLVVTVVNSGPRLWRNRLWIFLAIIATLIISSLFLGEQSLVYRLLSLGKERSELDRLDFVFNGLRYWLERPILGQGFHMHNFIDQLVPDLPRYYPHNFLVESLILGGLVLGGLFIAFVVFTALTSIRLITTSPAEIWLVLIWLQACVYVMFSGHLGNVPFFWFSSAAVCGRFQALSEVRIVRQRPWL